VDPAAFSVAAYGDSLTRGWGPTGGWPAHLPGDWIRFNSGIDTERGVPNLGTDGTATRSGTRRPITSPDLAALAGSWDVVVLQWGTNDVLYPGYQDELHDAPPDWPHVITDEDLMGSIEGAALTLRASGLRVVVVWPSPMLAETLEASLANTRLQRMREPLRTRVEAHGVTFVDLFAAFSPSPELPDPSLLYVDGLHWSAAGDAYAGSLIAQAILAGCPTGWAGERCELPLDECSPDPCRNGGTCTDGVASFTCSCPAGFTGETCEIDVDECSPDPCLNGGTCTDGVASFSCACPAGFTGETCEIDIDECSPDPCQNGGTCTDGVASFTCDCPAGFTGETCEINVDECSPDPCQNGGSCADGVASFTCSCPAGFAGETCEIDVDECSPDPCLNGGTCTDGVASFTCSCPAGFTGATCETNVDECAPDPCLNGGTCIDGVASFTCSCPAGFTGATCETNIDECSPDPCQNGGTCTDGVASFTCACQEGFAGPTCEEIAGG
jgi:lysophospholipase L1-like esterase